MSPPTQHPQRALLLFLDGVGIGSRDPARNPFLRARLPVLEALLGGRLPVELAPGEGWAGPEGVLVAADAGMGVPGRPQSGTGQTALLTGVNTAARYGRHFGPWVPTELRPLLAEENLLSRAVSAGRSAAFANAYPDEVRARFATGPRRPAAPPLAAHAAGLLVRGAEALRRGEAVASSLTTGRWRAHFPSEEIPEVAPREAGRTLARIAAGAELTLFAHYDTDLAGHAGEMAAAVAQLEKVDAFLGGVLEARTPDTLLVIASDHGNIEDASAGHTTNPVPVIGVGPGRERLREVRGITDVVPLLLEPPVPDDDGDAVDED